MASAIHLCHGPMPTNHPLLASGAMGMASRPSRVHLGLNKLSHFLSNYSKIHQVACPVWRVNCMFENSSLPPKKDENEYKIVRGMTGISLVLACVLGVFSFQGLIFSKSATAYAFPFLWKTSPSREDSLATIAEKNLQNNVDRVLDLWVKMIKYDNRSRPQLLPRLSKDDIDELKFYALGLSKSGKANEAFKVLDEAYSKYKDWPEEEKYLRMALIELLIFQGEFHQAEKRLDELINETIGAQESNEVLSEEDKIERLKDDHIKFSKVEIFLYKVIIHNKLAAKWWESSKTI